MSQTEKYEAIVNCRVSTPEQLQNNSLNRQLDSIQKAAIKLGVKIAPNGIWSGSVSSKAGTNILRRDLAEMVEYCKKHNSIKYLIVDEYDRFMRSVNEGAYFEVVFQQLGVKVWYAAESDAFNGDDAMAKFMRSMSGYKAEGSNEERQRKSVNGHRKALNEGRYTFPPKPGYMKSTEPGVHVPHPEQFKPMQQALKEVASRLYSPSEALKRLNMSVYTKNKAPMKIDRFKHWLADPYYYGVVKIEKQINAENPIGKHKPMLTKLEFDNIQAILEANPTRQIVKKKYNPEFPLNALLTHACCPGSTFTGFVKNNGHGGKYPKYRCSICKKEFHRDDINAAISEILSRYRINNKYKNRFISALKVVWNSKKQDNINQLRQISRDIRELEDKKSKLILKLADVDDSISKDIEAEITNIKLQITSSLDRKGKLADYRKDLVRFTEYAFSYIENLSVKFWVNSFERRQRCQLLLFKGRIQYQTNKKVGTTNIPLIYRLATTKKDPENESESLLVELAGSAPASIRFEKISSSSIVDS